MDTTTLDSSTITLMATIAGTWLTLVGLIIFQVNRLDTKIDTKIDNLSGIAADTRERLVRVEEHLEDHGRQLSELGESSRERGRVLGEVRERLARVEGYLMTPEDFRMHHHPPQTGADPAAEDSEPGYRQAG